jgi:hypothetical protein
VQQQTQRAVQGVKQQTEDEANYYLNAYNQAMQEGDWNYANRIAPIAKEAKEAFIAGIEERIGDKTLTLEDYLKAREVFVRNYNPSPQELQELDNFYINEINKIQEEKFLESFDIKPSSNRYTIATIDPDRGAGGIGPTNTDPFDMFSTKNKVTDPNFIRENQEKMRMIKANPQAFEGKIVKFKKGVPTRETVLTFVIHNGELIEIKDKNKESEEFTIK